MQIHEPGGDQGTVGIDRARRRAAHVGAQVGDRVTVDGDTPRHGGATGAVDDQAVGDEQVMGHDRTVAAGRRPHRVDGPTGPISYRMRVVSPWYEASPKPNMGMKMKPSSHMPMP